MSAQSMDDSSIRDLERECQKANADFHAQADSTIKHADILEQQVRAGKLDSSKYRVREKTGSQRRLSDSVVMRQRQDPKV